jgi:hypothetical protein
MKLYSSRQQPQGSQRKYYHATVTFFYGAGFIGPELKSDHVEYLIVRKQSLVSKTQIK